MQKSNNILLSIREKILLNQLKPGSPIPEDSLAAEFKVSRTPVREALIVLATQRLVDLEKNRGARVASVTIEGIRALFVAAAPILRSAASLVAERASDRSLDSLADCLGKMDANIQNVDVAAQSRSSCMFLEALVRESGNPFIFDVSCSLIGYHAFVRSSVMTGMNASRARDILVEEMLHLENIQEALVRRDAAETADMIDQMLEGSRVMLFSNLL